MRKTSAAALLAGLFGGAAVASAAAPIVSRMHPIASPAPPGVAARAQSHAGAAAPSIKVTSRAQVEKQSLVDGRPVLRLLPANRVVAGDLVVYTLEVRNAGTAVASAVAFSSPIPRHLRYLANSAVGPGAELSFSVDGGQSYDAPAQLTVLGADGKPRPADAADYTNIRWVLKDPLQPGSVAYARYLAMLR
ncbi:MAG TPA: hypothetical protein VMV25_03160 [Steroidobacteraceae bacterium]|nr:hypothetical protein [Steroidobacteraceae bacterium]